MLNSRVREHVQTKLQEIADKAKTDKKYRFYDLYRMINRESLFVAWYELNKNAASGIDRITACEYEKNLTENIIALEGRLKEKRYKAKFVLRVYIPKSNGKLRPLGIPALEDKLVQSAAANILKAIYEQDFLECSFAYRDKIGALQAVKDITKNLMFGKYSYIVDADIQGFFDNLDHNWLVQMLEQRINDSAFINLIKKWLKAGIMDKGIVLHPEKGTPQGGLASPVLSNIYLHYVLDLWFEKKIKPRCEGQAYLCRYADDFVCAFQYQREAENFFKELENRLKKFGLETAKDKTKIIRFTRFNKVKESVFTFLGFEFRWGLSRKGKDIVIRKTAKKKFKQGLRGFKEWIKKNINKKISWIMNTLKLKLIGYYNYYGVIGNIKRLVSYFNGILRLLFKWLNRRSQRRSFNYKGFGELCKQFNIPRPRIVEKNFLFV